MSTRVWLPVGAAMMAVAVVMGALGAHGLHARLILSHTLEFYDTAVRYQMAHAIGLMAVGLAAGQGYGGRALAAAGWLMLLGIVLFSGSLYGLGLTGAHVLGLLTPFGGVSFIASWILLTVATLRPASPTAG